jgi:hypothetical protein
MKSFSTLCAILMMANVAFAGKKFKEIRYQFKTQNHADLVITFDNAITNDAESKFKIKVKNNSQSYYILKFSECSVSNGSATMKIDEKDMIIYPFDDASKVVNIKGATANWVDRFIFKLDGVYTLKMINTPIAVPSFELPVTQNEINTAAFHIVHKNNDRKTDLTLVKFGITYRGTKIGIFDPKLTVLEFPNGAEFANMKGSNKPHLMKPGEDENEIFGWHKIDIKNGDMQFVNLEIVWKDCFKEADLEPHTGISIDLEIDDSMSK